MALLPCAELLEPKEPNPYEARLVCDNVRLGPGYARCLVASLLGAGPGFNSLAPDGGAHGHGGDKKKDGGVAAVIMPPPGVMLSGAPLPPLSAQYRPLEELVIIEAEVRELGH